MAPRHLEYNDAILAFEAASIKRPTDADFEPFISWLESDPQACKTIHKMSKRFRRIVLDAYHAGKPVHVFMRTLPEQRPYTYMKLQQENAWLQRKAVEFGLTEEMIVWQIESHR